MNYHGTRHYPSLIPREQDLMSLSGTSSMKLCRWCLLSPPTRRKDATGLQTAIEEVPCGPWGPVALPHRHRATPAPGKQTRPWLERVGKEVERKETVKDSLVLNPARGSSFFYLNFLNGPLSSVSAVFSTWKGFAFTAHVTSACPAIPLGLITHVFPEGGPGTEWVLGAPDICGMNMWRRGNVIFDHLSRFTDKSLLVQQMVPFGIFKSPRSVKVCVKHNPWYLTNVQHGVTTNHSSVFTS